MFENPLKFFNIYKIIFSIISKKQKLLLLYQSFLMLIAVVLDIFSIALIIPLFGIYLSNQYDLSEKLPYLNKYLNLIGFSASNFLIFFLLIICFKSIFNSYFSWQQANLKYSIESNLSFKLYKKFMRMKFDFHNENNADKLISHVVHDAASVGEVIFFSMQMATDLLILTFLLILLGVIDWVGLSIFFFILAISGLLYLRLSKHRILLLGKIRSNLQSERINLLAQSLSAIKEIRVMGRENYFFNKVWNVTSGTLAASRNNQFIQELPRVWLDLIATIGLISVASMLMVRGSSVAELISIFALFSAAAFRVMPAISRVLNCFHSIRYGFTSLNILSKNFEVKIECNNTKVLQIQPKIGISSSFKKIRLCNLSYAYPFSNKNVLTNLSFEINNGDFVGITGHSGAGKSTLMNILLGLIPISEGHIECDGASIFDDLEGWRGQIGYVPQNIFIVDDTLRRNIAFGLDDDEICDDRIKKALINAQLWNFAESKGLDFVLGRVGNRISGGQKQRIGIARALYSDPSILIFDEPTNGLDENSENAILETLTTLRAQKTIVMITHSIANLKYCNKFINL